MAKFNPEVKTVEPTSYLGYSRGIDQPEGDKSMGLLLGGIGDALTTAVKAIDEGIKTSIDTEVYTAADREREKQVSALETVAGVPAAERTTAPMGTDILPSRISGAQETTPPPEVESSVKAGESLAAGASQGKLIPTYYTGRLDTVLKDIRSRYPGYRSYVDSRFAAATGGHSANDYLSSLVRQINSRTSGATASANRDMALINAEAKEGNPEAPLAMQMLQQGHWSSENGKLTAWLSKTNKLKWDVQDSNNRLALVKNDREQASFVANEEFLKTGSTIVNNGMVTFFDATAGVNQEVSLQKMGDLVARYQRGELPANDAEMMQLSQMLRAYRGEMERRVDKFATQPTPNGSIKGLLGDKYNERHKEVFRVVDQMIDAVDKKDVGLAYRNAQFIDARGKDVGAGLLNAPGVVGEWANAQAGATAIGGINGANALMPAYRANDLRAGLQQIIQLQVSKIAAGPEFVGPRQHTLTDALREMKEQGIGIQDPNNPNPTKRTDHKAVKEVVAVTDKITSPQIPDKMKENIINGAYGPGNEKLIDNFAQDYIKDGKPVPGKNDIFIGMTTKDKTEEIWKQGQKNSQLWWNYRRWAELTHGELFGQTIRDFNQIDDDPRIQITYDAQNYRFSINAVGPTHPGMVRVQRKLSADMALKESQMNQGLSSMANIIAKDNADPTAINAYLIELMQAQGMEVTRGLGLKMLTSVMTSLTKPKVTGSPAP